VKLRAALGETLKLATAVNQYLDTNAPWKQVKEDKAEAAKTVYTALKAIDSLKVLFSPILPFTSEKLHGFFGYETPLFGEQYIEEISDSLGTHKGLKYRPAAQSPQGEPVEAGSAQVKLK
jgi:methionyl-tRNA synthetase